MMPYPKGLGPKNKYEVNTFFKDHISDFLFLFLFFLLQKNKK
jgi:hypothetical protein